MPRITFRGGLNRETRHPNGASKPNSEATPGVRTNKPQANDNPTVNLTIAAVRALGVLCIKVGDILDCTSSDRGLSSEQRVPAAVAEGRAASLDPSTFIDDEDVHGNAA
jgi:hypothetical protein